MKSIFGKSCFGWLWRLYCSLRSYRGKKVWKKKVVLRVEGCGGHLVDFMVMVLTRHGGIVSIVEAKLAFEYATK